MRRRSPAALVLAGALAAAAIAAVADSHPATAGGLFGDISHFFGGSRDERFAPMTAYAEPTAPADKATDLQGPPSVALGGATTYCVRLCDGRYFPLSAPASRAGAAKVCSAMCPASATAIFGGGDIDHAFGARGERYADLAHAFLYRERIVADCTCNGRDAFGLAPIDVADDPTLRVGDVVATRSGLEMFKGSRRDGPRNAEFTPIRRESASAELKRVLAGMRLSRSD